MDMLEKAARATTATVAGPWSDDHDAFWRDIRAFVAEHRRAPKAEVHVGSMDAFKAWVEAHIGPLKTDDRLKGVGSFFGGVPVIHDWRLPEKRAALLVDNEVHQIIDLDSRP